MVFCVTINLHLNVVGDMNIELQGSLREELASTLEELQQDEIEALPTSLPIYSFKFRFKTQSSRTIIQHATIQCIHVHHNDTQRGP